MGREAADWPTIRGVIDLLLVERGGGRGGGGGGAAAEVVDYKTDSAFLWKSRLEDYRRQMRYYMVAAGEILGFPAEKATLVFLAAREEVVVQNQVRIMPRT